MILCAAVGKIVLGALARGWDLWNSSTPVCWEGKQTLRQDTDSCLELATEPSERLPPCLQISIVVLEKAKYMHCTETPGSHAHPCTSKCSSSLCAMGIWRVHFCSHSLLCTSHFVLFSFQLVSCSLMKVHSFIQLFFKHLLCIIVLW